MPERDLAFEQQTLLTGTVEDRDVPAPFEAALDPIEPMCGVAEDRLGDTVESEAKNRRVEVGAVVFAVAWFMSTSLAVSREELDCAIARI